MNLTVSNEILSQCPDTALGALFYSVEVTPSDAAFLKKFEMEITRLQECYTLESIARNEHISATRAAYKKLGKSPHEYRNAAEAMLRRIVKGNGLYHINNVVELNNLISVSSGYSIGSYDVECLHGDVELRYAPESAHYDGIGKSSVNIGLLPVLYDELGAFGNPTSDSKRAMILAGNKKVMSVLYSFDGKQGLESWMREYENCLIENLGVREIVKLVV